MSISYKDAIKSSMQSISEKKEAVFIGYNLKYGSRCYGTMDTIPEDKIYEMPVAEDLMTGVATGMALGGYLPVLVFERQDFMLIASDQIINHLSKISELVFVKDCAEEIFPLLDPRVKLSVPVVYESISVAMILF